MSSESSKILYDSRQVWRERRPNRTKAGFREKKRHFFLRDVKKTKARMLIMKRNRRWRPMAG